MLKFANLINQLRSDYSQLEFRSDEIFHFHAPNTIFYNPNAPYNENQKSLLVLHELGHFLVQRYDYQSDIELLNIEAQAWQQAQSLTEKYHITWDEDFTQAQLDTYRNWLHFESLCPNCQINGYQDSDQLYHCPLCEKTWRPKFIPE